MAILKSKQNKSYIGGANKYLKISIATLAVIVIAVLVLGLTNTINIFHKQKVVSVIKTSHNTTPSLKAAPANPSSTAVNTGSATTKSTADSAGSSTSSNSSSLIAPYGDFVSNHHPSSTTSYNEVSVCNTTPGASCYIEFTNGQTVKQLPAQTVDGDGATSWSWNVFSDAHLTSGSWLITAVASINNSIKSTNDQLELIVQ